ncbi:MAG: isocitrate lyase/PEP mutase family protein [Hyphomicrobiaceae bacterium]|jgi:methylisocitrate lyase
MSTLRDLIAGPQPVPVPLVFNPMTAKLAEAAGFKALYLGGGSMGYLKCVTEANLNLTEMCQAGLDIRSVCSLPLILDGACGWGDPMHMHRTIGMSEAAGFSAIEIEDQILPKRTHHHIGIEHIVSAELMVAKIKEALAARRSRDFLIIARTNAARMHGLDEALSRAEAYKQAGADMLLVLAKTPDQVATIGQRVDHPMVLLASGDARAATGLSPADLHGLGYRLLIDASTPLMAAHRALRQCYAALAANEPDPLLGASGNKSEERIVHETIGLEHMLEIERRTVER